MTAMDPDETKTEIDIFHHNKNTHGYDKNTTKPGR